MGEPTKPSGPDLATGVALAQLVDGTPLLGQTDGEAVIIVRRGGDVFAVGATCTHYSGPLAEGLVVGETIRCPWHHACFSLRTGEAVAAPALSPVPCYRVERDGDRVRVVGKREPAARRSTSPLERVVIVGAGAAGQAAAEMLRREGFAGAITLVGAESSAPVDRPNLSKDYLAGTAPEEWVTLRPPDFYRDQGIELVSGVRVSAIDPAARQVRLDGGRALAYDALLLATGAEPIGLSIPGADLPHVHVLRTLADSRAIITDAVDAAARAGDVPGEHEGGRAVVVGTSFIGLEAAASLRARKLAVDVVGRDARPLAKILGPELGALVQAIHEEHGVTFHLSNSPTRIDRTSVTLASGAVLPADLVVAGIGVRPATALAEQAGIAVDRGVVVDAELRTSVPGIFAAGDIARYPDRRRGGSLRIEHWVVAQRQGQVAAKNMLGAHLAFEAVPYFWSQHYDVAISYVGHAEKWDRIEVAGDLRQRDALVAYFADGQIVAVATIGRDGASLEAEAAFERQDQAALARLLAH